MSFLPPYKPITWAIISAGGLIILLGIVLLGAKSCSNWNFNRGMKGANANLANAINALANIQDQSAAKEKELQAIKEQEAAAQQAVKDAAKDVEEATKAEANTNAAAGQANANTQAVNAKDFTNTTLSNAQRARCLAFPDAEECK